LKSNFLSLICRRDYEKGNAGGYHRIPEEIYQQTNRSDIMFCTNCSKEINEGETYTVDYKPMCEDCAIETGLFPLEHTSSSRDKISEKGRQLTVRDPD
jgi:hypothetical protein